MKRATVKQWQREVVIWGTLIPYSLSRKTVNAGENFWNVYCFATNQIWDKTAEDTRQTAALISHDLIQNNELAFSSTTDFQFYRFQVLRLFFLCFSLFICKE